MVQLQEATIKAQCKQLRMPVMAAQFSSVAEQAVREKKSHSGYLEALLGAELEVRLAVTTLRAVLNAAIDDRLIEHNPAQGLGRFVKSEKATREATSLKSGEVEQ